MLEKPASSVMAPHPRLCAAVPTLRLSSGEHIFLGSLEALDVKALTTFYSNRPLEGFEQLQSIQSGSFWHKLSRVEGLGQGTRVPQCKFCCLRDLWVSTKVGNLLTKGDNKMAGLSMRFNVFPDARAPKP